MIDIRVALAAFLLLIILPVDVLGLFLLVKRHRENMASDRRFRKAYNAMLEQMEGIPPDVSELWGSAIDRVEEKPIDKN